MLCHYPRVGIQASEQSSETAVDLYLPFSFPPHQDWREQLAPDPEKTWHFPAPGKREWPPSPYGRNRSLASNILLDG